MYGICGNDHVVIVTRNFTKRVFSFPLPLPSPSPSLAPSTTGLYRSSSRSILPFAPFSPKYRRTLPFYAADAPDPPLAVMHYETRNDESAYVSHVMEIPLLIRALNDSATAGYITCIITCSQRRGIRETCPLPSPLPPPLSFLFLHSGSGAFVIIDRQKATERRRTRGRSSSANATEAISL